MTESNDNGVEIKDFPDWTIQMQKGTMLWKVSMRDHLFKQYTVGC